MSASRSKNEKRITNHISQNSNNESQVATLISRIVDPPVVLSVLTTIGIFRSGVSFHGMAMMGLLLPFFVGVPIVYFLWLLKTHRIHNVDVTNRKERIKPLLGLLIFLLVDVVILSLFDNPFLVNMFMLYILWTFGFLLITLYWKISGHTGIATIACGLLWHWFGIGALPVVLIVPVVAWARIIRRDHTLLQVIAGILYSCGVLAIWRIWVY